MPSKNGEISGRYSPHARSWLPCVMTKDVQSMHLQIDYLTEKYKARIELLRAPLVEISSTAIRRRASRGLSVRYMVPDAVAEYIAEHQLYRNRIE